MRYLHSAVFFFMGLILTGCEKPTEPAPQILKQVSEQGLIVPGRLGDAKAMGLTDCTADFYAYFCSKIGGEVYGFKVKKFSVALNGHNNFAEDFSNGSVHDVRNLAPDELSYREIRLEIKPEDAVRFEEKLVSAGWRKTSSRRNSSYYKADIPAYWSIGRDGVELRAVAVKYANAELTSLEEREAEQARLEKNANAVLNEMKK